MKKIVNKPLLPPLSDNFDVSVGQPPVVNIPKVSKDAGNEKLISEALGPPQNRNFCKEVGSLNQLELMISFFRGQILSSRPGLSIMILNSIAEVSTDVESFWHYIIAICKNVFESIRGRKDDFINLGTIWSLLGCQANFCTLDDKSRIYHEFVNKHFFKMVNPYESELTVKSFNYFEVHAYYENNSELIITFKRRLSNGDIASYESQFKVRLPPFADEFFLHLALWNSWEEKFQHKGIVNFDMGHEYRKFINLNEKINNFDGQAAERFWSAVIVNASHRDIFLQLNGRLFVDSILASLGEMKVKKNPHTSKMYYENVEYSAKMQNFLESLCIPYLAASGQGLNDIMLRLLYPRVGYCRRTEFREQVDFTFDIIGGTAKAPFCGLVEMKDWDRNLHVGSLVNIYSRISGFKSLNRNFTVKLHFIFCRSISDTIKKFKVQKTKKGEKKYDFRPSTVAKQDLDTPCTTYSDEIQRLEDFYKAKKDIAISDTKKAKDDKSAAYCLRNLLIDKKMSVYYGLKNSVPRSQIKTYQFEPVFEVEKPVCIGIIFPFQEGRGHCGNRKNIS
jgi:hypothetical protein